MVPQAPFAAQPAQQRPDFDVDLGPAASDSARLKAQTHDPLEPVNIGPGGTFGMDPLSNKTSTTFHYAQQVQPALAPAPQEDFELQLQPAEEPAVPAYTPPITPAPTPAPAQEPMDELDALINRAVSGHAPYYAPRRSAPKQRWTCRSPPSLKLR